jgi:hypothetical protein
VREPEGVFGRFYQLNWFFQRSLLKVLVAERDKMIVSEYFTDNSSGKESSAMATCTGRVEESIEFEY